MTGDIKHYFELYVLQDSYVSFQCSFIHTSSYTSKILYFWAWPYQESPHRNVALNTSPQNHLTKQQRHLVQSESYQSSKLIFETSRGISLALRGHKKLALTFAEPNSKKSSRSGNIRTTISLYNYIFVVSECYDSGLHSILIRNSIFGQNTTEINMMTKLYNCIVSA